MVLNLVGGFQALGTLLAVGLMMLPAAAARFWVRNLWPLLRQPRLALPAGYRTAALLPSDPPSGPSIVLLAGLLLRLAVLGRATACAPSICATATSKGKLLLVFERDHARLKGVMTIVIRAHRTHVPHNGEHPMFEAYHGVNGAQHQTNFNRLASPRLPDDFVERLRRSRRPALCRGVGRAVRARLGGGARGPMPRDIKVSSRTRPRTASPRC